MPWWGQSKPGPLEQQALLTAVSSDPVWSFWDSLMDPSWLPIHFVAEDNNLYLILLPPQSSAGITGICHLSQQDHVLGIRSMTTVTQS